MYSCMYTRIVTTAYVLFECACHMQCVPVACSVLADLSQTSSDLRQMASKVPRTPERSATAQAQAHSGFGSSTLPEARLDSRPREPRVWGA